MKMPDQQTVGHSSLETAIDALEDAVRLIHHLGGNSDHQKKAIRLLRSQVSKTKPTVCRLASISKLVADHHRDQFGDVSWLRLATKLGEETGELQGAIIRDTESRDGRRWLNEIYSELQDVLVVLHVMTSRMGEELSKVSDDAGEHFSKREFHNITKCDD